MSQMWHKCISLNSGQDGLL